MAGNLEKLKALVGMVIALAVRFLVSPMERTLPPVDLTPEYAPSYEIPD